MTRPARAVAHRAGLTAVERRSATGRRLPTRTGGRSAGAPGRDVGEYADTAGHAVEGRPQP
ncbi:hypothetical protein OG689_35520 [Kitasatospora sp. NBC_00240]|uniref:hypothetical protein n=1 Tax=Kitasatospora sp. NBC_00240 TaxID=2903567 RepID=UPI002257DB68|nr:hypothetical protein [Kitasatospora sp. NBC_00240]MCX5214510.1 hypothetical protein [Kitasatospora sp. NBC_00240]